MGRQARPTRVFKTMTEKLASTASWTAGTPPPPWYAVMTSHPPSAALSRPAAVQLQMPNPRQRRPRNVYKPQAMTYPEDELRKTFFRDHPWELARPRLFVESDGRDAEGFDWSKGLRQPGMMLSGESVVQRQLWLMQNTRLTRPAAYDKARREFYDLRQQEQIEQRIAREEARFVGAYFDKSRLERGHEMEGREFERWKKWAKGEKGRRVPTLAAREPEEAADGDTSASLLNALIDTASPNAKDTRAGGRKEKGL